MTESSKLWLRSLTIHRYEQFRDCPRVEFSPDDNLILGVNGSGKTSLLRLLAAVLRWNYDALLGHPFDIEFEQVLDQGSDATLSIFGRVRHQPVLPGVGQQSQSRRGSRSKYDGLEARFDIRYDNRACAIEIRDSTIQAVGGNDPSGTFTPVQSWMANEVADVLAAYCAAEEPADESMGSIAFELSDCADDTFVVRETDIDFAQLAKHLPYGSMVDGPPLRADLGMIWVEQFAEPQERQWAELMGELLLRAPAQSGEQAYLPPVIYKPGASSSQKYDMSALLAALDAESVSFRPKIEKAESIDGGIRFEGKGVEIRVRFPSGTEVVDSRLTFGQKRLITIALGALLCRGSPLLLDEIDNGLHPGLVEKTLELIRGRQTFIASHNKLVVDLLDYESPEDMRRTIHVCRREQDGTQSLIELSDDQVREVFEKVTVGIMNPSDVLLREGLW